MKIWSRVEKLTNKASSETHHVIKPCDVKREWSSVETTEAPIT